MKKFTRFIIHPSSLIILLTFCLLAFPLLNLLFAADIITTIAGTGTAGYSGDGGGAKWHPN